jgi:hypothetical protein
LTYLQLSNFLLLLLELLADGVLLGILRGLALLRSLFVLSVILGGVETASSRLRGEWPHSRGKL